MKTITKFLTVFTYLAAAFAAQQSKGQLTAKQAIFVSGGNYGAAGNKVKFYAFDIASKQVKAFDSVPGDYTNVAVISGDTAYFNVDTLLYRYNITTYKRIDSVLLPGINNMLIYKNFLIVGRGYPDTSNFIEVYNKNSLSLLYKDTNYVYGNRSGDGIVINKDTAYIALENSGIGLMEELSLSQSTPRFVKLINLGVPSKGLQNLYTDGVNIYGLAYYNGISDDILTYNLSADTLFYSRLAAVATNGVTFYDSIIYGDFILGLRGYNPYRDTFGNMIWGDYTAAVFDSIDKDFYLVNSNYTTPDKVYELNISGKVTDSFMVGISTQAIAIQYAMSTKTGIQSPTEATPNITLYPNPSNTKINVIYPTNEASITISDITGRTVYSTNKTGINNGATIDVSGLTNGVYIVQLVSETGVADVKFIKD